MQLQCSQCGADVPAEKINMQQMMAVCPACNNFFKIGDYSEAPKTKSHKLKQPQEISVEEGEDSLKLSFQRISEMEQRMFYGLSVLDVIMVIILVAVLQDLSNSRGTDMLTLVVPFVLLLSYTLCVLAFNSTSITIDLVQLDIEQGPLPFVASEVKTGAWMIDDVRSFRSVQNTAATGSKPLYHIILELADGSELVLFKNISKEHAQYITQKLETFVQHEKRS